MSEDLNLNSIEFQSNLRSKPIRQNFTDIQNNFNALRSEFATSVSSTASEITNARDNLSALDDNIHLRSQYYGYVNTGGLVTAQGTPDNTILVSAGSGIVNGIGVDFTAATSATMSAPTTGRYDVVAINSDNTLSIEAGNDSADKILPSLASTQRPLAIITQDTANPLTITNSDITEIRRQGCIANGKWFFKIQDAVNYISSGEIIVKAGNYYEEIDLSGKSNIILKGEPGTNVYRPDGSSRALKSINTSGNEGNDVVVEDFAFYGNSKTGSISNVEIDYTDNFSMVRCYSDTNASSTATYPEMRITNSDQIDMSSCNGEDISNWIDTSNCTKFFLNSRYVTVTDRPKIATAFLNGSSINEATFVAPILAAIPTDATGIEYPISGTYFHGSVHQTLNAVKRINSTDITLYGYRIDTLVLRSFTVGSGGSLTGINAVYSM